MISFSDCTRTNLMMDASALYPKGFHPALPVLLPDRSDLAPSRSRLFAPLRYYYADFGISVHIIPGQSPLVTGGYGRDQEVPELSFTDRYDPFKVDVFILGNVFRKEILDVRRFTLL